MEEVRTERSYPSREQQRAAYLEGEWGNPLTTSPTGGRILSALQRPLFTMFPPHGFGVLTTTGRKTGKKRSRCVRVIRRADKAYLVSLGGPYSAWFRNLAADSRVRLRIRGGTFDGVARPIDDPAELERARAAYCETVNRFDRAEYRAHRRGKPTAERIKELHARWFAIGIPIVIELDPSDQSTGT